MKVEQSNLYGLQHDISKPLNLTFSELEQGLRMTMYFFLRKIPNTILHWSLRFRNDFVTGIISCDRWIKIEANIHLTDNENVGPGDTVYKISPLVDQLLKEFRKIPMRENLCIDEQMVPFKGKSWLKQYKATKTHNWVYKFFLL